MDNSSKGNSMKPQEHAFKTFQKSLESGTFPSVMLLYGKEDYLVNWALKALTSALVEPAVLVMDRICISENEISVSQIVSACQTVPMMSLRKLVIVEGCDAFSGNRSMHIPNDEQHDLVEYIKDIPESTLLVFTV